MATSRLRMRVSGSVHGVFFRQSTLQEAQRLGLAGWVQNLPDGSVEIEAEGPDAALDELAAWAQHGPPAARVSQVHQRRLPSTGEDRTFAVRR